MKPKITKFGLGVIGGVFATLCSPYFTHHLCALDSEILKGFLTVSSVLVFTIIPVTRTKVKFSVIWCLASVPVALVLTELYFSALHSERFPDFLLDKSSREWREEMRHFRENMND